MYLVSIAKETGCLELMKYGFRFRTVFGEKGLEECVGLWD
jgi:hypothetical protein